MSAWIQHSTRNETIEEEEVLPISRPTPRTFPREAKDKNY
jgi:hypothetical protein